MQRSGVDQRLPVVGLEIIELGRIDRRRESER